MTSTAPTMRSPRVSIPSPWRRRGVDPPAIVRQRGPQVAPHDLKYLRLVGSFTIVHATLDAPQRWQYVFDSSKRHRASPIKPHQLCTVHHVPVAFVRDSVVRGGTLFPIPGRTGQEVLCERRKRGSAATTTRGLPMSFTTRVTTQLTFGAWITTSPRLRRRFSTPAFPPASPSVFVDRSLVQPFSLRPGAFARRHRSLRRAGPIRFRPKLCRFRPFLALSG